jgi:hypothetical protein
MSRLVLFSFSTLAAVAVADAGVAIEFSHADGSNGSPGTIEVFLDGHNLAASMAEGHVVFRGEDQLMWFAEAGKGTYYEMTADDVKAVTAQMDQAMKMMEEQLANLPAEQQAMMRGMLEERMSSMPMMAEQRVEPMGEKKVDGYPCVGYQVFSNDEPSAVVWTTNVTELDLGAADFVALRDLEAFMGSSPLAKMLGRYLHDFSAPPAPGRVSGFPVLIEETGGPNTGTIRLVSARHSDVPGDAFAEPEGLEKKKIEDLSGLGG